LREDENPQKKEWCSRDNGEVYLNNCSISASIEGLSFEEMRVVANDIRAALKEHGFDPADNKDR
jgi:hypothetical protein